MGYWFAFVFSVTLIGPARVKKEEGGTFECASLAGRE